MIAISASPHSVGPAGVPAPIVRAAGLVALAVWGAPELAGAPVIAVPRAGARARAVQVRAAQAVVARALAALARLETSGALAASEAVPA